ncbi:flavinator of succinate dehydrogenase [Nitzschia inconspicua]|uniref:Flavinator of succinate dehydrogenase n=1 Tax=Nitzschia inconspicua TaxID=303405 RepID=A0A9K3Q7J1_9STRA|nr:flavinator of succinate dehydrogenase [Nitzschia inconspicua]
MISSQKGCQLAASCSRMVATRLRNAFPSAAATTLANKVVETPMIFQTTRRGYKGNAGDAMDKLSAEEVALLKIAQPKAEEIFRNHTALPVDDVETRRKRLIYRAKQRGWLEVDLLLGTWASENVANLNSDELDQFEAFVNMETIDIYNVITLRLDVPEEMKRNGQSVAEKIQEWARSSPLGKADPDMYKAVKTEHKLI